MYTRIRSSSNTCFASAGIAKTDESELPPDMIRTALVQLVPIIDRNFISSFDVADSVNGTHFELIIPRVLGVRHAGMIDQTDSGELADLLRSLPSQAFGWQDIGRSELLRGLVQEIVAVVVECKGSEADESVSRF